MLASLASLTPRHAGVAMRLRKPAGLGDRRAFLRVQGSGHKFRGRTLIMQVVKSETPGAPRVGFTVSRKVGNAVVRNRVRRRLKEIIRLAQRSLNLDHEFVLIALPGAARASYDALQQEVQCLLDRVRGWVSSPSSSSL